MTRGGLAATHRALVSSWIGAERGRSLLTLLGVALGVAVLVSISIANESAVQSFKDTLDGVAGRAAITVRGNGIGLPAALLPSLASTPGVRSVAPLVMGHASYQPATGAPPETLLLLGADLLASTERDELPIRDLRYSMAPGRAPGSVLADPTALVFSRRFVERAGAALGGSIELTIAGSTRPFVVAAWIEEGGLTDTLDGRIAIADIGIVDALLGRHGRIDRFDLTLDDGAAVEEVMRALTARVPSSALVERPGTRGAEVDSMLAAFRFNLDMLGRIAILVGAFLIYNTMSIAVVRRRPAIGTLRALGVTRLEVLAVFLAEGLAFGVVGGVLGVVAGVALAWVLLGSVAQAVSINFFETSPTSLTLAPGLLLGALGFALALSLLAALGPAREAASTMPANTMRSGSLAHRPGRLGLRLAAGLALLALTALVARAGVGSGARGIPVRGYLAAMLLLAGFLCLGRPAVHAAARLLRRAYARAFGAEGLLAVAGTQAALGRASVAISGLVVALAMTVSIGVMVSSFRDTVTGWMEQVLRADLYVSPMGPLGRVAPEPMPAALAARLARIPGVAAVDPFRARRVTILGRETWLGAGALDVVRFTSRALDGREAVAVMREARATGGVIVSEALARKLDVGTGDMLPIPTPGGRIHLRIAGVYADYSSEQGFVIMDRELYLRHFDDPDLDSIALYLAPGADRARVRRDIDGAAREVAGATPIAVRANDDLRTTALAAFNRTFAITWTLEAIAVLVAVLGVATTLLAQVLDRRHEIAALRWLGARRTQIARIIVLEASLIGLSGCTLGALCGVGLAWILTRLIMLESFGWTISFGVPVAGVLTASFAVFVATLLSGLLPAREASRVGTVTGLGEGR